MNVNNPVITLTAQGTGTVNQAVNVGTAKGVLVIYNITAGTGTSPTLTVTISGLTPDGQNVAYTILASTALAAGSPVAGQLTVYPGAAVTANVSASTGVPSNIQIGATVAGTTPTVTGTISVQPLL